MVLLPTSSLLFLLPMSSSGSGSPANEFLSGSPVFGSLALKFQFLVLLPTSSTVSGSAYEFPSSPAHEFHNLWFSCQRVPFWFCPRVPLFFCPRVLQALVLLPTSSLLVLLPTSSTGPGFPANEFPSGSPANEFPSGSPAHEFPSGSPTYEFRFSYRRVSRSFFSSCQRVPFWFCPPRQT